MVLYMRMWTIGTSTRSLEEFLNLLKRHGIDVIVDIRRFPTSRFEYFRKENLEKSLDREGIKYLHLKGLGGYRGGYKKYMQTEEFRTAFKRLLSLARKERVAIMCAELLFLRCHRRYVSDELTRHGVKVIHIIDSRVYEHTMPRRHNIFKD